MCDVPSKGIFFLRESIECSAGIVFRYLSVLYLKFQRPNDPGMTEHFIFHIAGISVFGIWCFNLFSASCSITYIPIRWYCYVYQEENFVCLVF